MAQRLPKTSNSNPRMYSIYRMSDTQPDWAQDDPSQPDYIKNKELVEKFRPVSVEGEEILNESYASGGLNLVGGRNVTLDVEGNTIVISARSSGGEGGGCDCPEYIEGEGIDITENQKGQQVISIEEGAVSDNMIESVSIDKIVQKEGVTLILNGGSIDG
jgi:hypothetical protein